MSLAQRVAALATRHGRDHDVRIVLNNRFPESVEEVIHAFDGLLPKEQFRVFEVPQGTAAMYPYSAWRMHAAERIRESVISEMRPDVVHVASLFEGWVDDAATSIAKGPTRSGATAVTLYDLIPLVRKEIYLVDSQMRAWYYEKLEALKRADLLMSISEYTRSEAMSVLQLPADHVVNISAAIDDVFQPRQMTPEAMLALGSQYGLTRPYLMYTGGIDPRKNIEGLIESFARLPAKTIEAHQLAIVCNASESDRQRLSALAERAGLKRDTLVMTGFVPEGDLIDLYNGATAFAFPSLHEGFGLPVLEAMACGIPVIGANTSSIPEVINFEDALFDPTNIDAMAAKVNQVLTDEVLRRSLREHALVQARRFSWDECARRAMEGFEALHERTSYVPGAMALLAGDALEGALSPKPDVASTSPKARPGLVYLSPLAPDKSGIADYSAELLRELVQYYDVTVVVRSAGVDDPWIQANCHVCSVAWFETNADDFDHVVYHFGNSEFHDHMFELLKRFPGIVVLHDFFLSGVINHIEDSGEVPYALTRALYASHGYPALSVQRMAGKLASIWSYPGNRLVLDDAVGVIVHSQFSKELANEWYGPGVSDDWTVIPHLRALPQLNRDDARRRLGLSEKDFLTCAFGLLGETKLNRQLLDAWLASPLAEDSNCQLVFVGENDPGVYGIELTKRIRDSGRGSRIKITGFAARSLYLDYLAASDSAVQLRGRSRGETSGTILDCLAHGIPTIINANGSAAEVPDDVVMKMPDSFTQAMLTKYLSSLRDTSMAQALSARAKEFIGTRHHPTNIGKQYRDAIEQLSVRAMKRKSLLRALSRIEGTADATDVDLIEAVRSIAWNQGGPSSPRQLLVDVSELVQRDAKSGIQRVVRNVLSILLRNSPEGYRVEPVYQRDGRYLYARNFTCAMLGLDDSILNDEEVEPRPQDRFLGLDLYPDGVVRNERLFHEFRNRGVSVYFVVYDLLPVLRPDTFVANADVHFAHWLKAISRAADGLICISRAVADELCEWVARADVRRCTPLNVGYFHLGADLSVGAPPHVSRVPDKADRQRVSVLEHVKARPSLLMVGTVERRKAHAQALSALELLWARGAQVNLVIVGKQGWMADELIKTLRNHPENGKRLFWLEKASDALLLELYDCASGLLVASEGEGFGLPLIEAAQHGLPIVARDLPVFREVAGEHAFYFSGTSAESLAEPLTKWLSLLEQRSVPDSSGMRWLTWAESTERLLNVISDRDWYRVVSSSRSTDK
ncbi:glycosyltransferase involved in cell wall biosynthesis [Paraburkholderia rhizosphaerae]|uniref:Glycosyltransferase involved in cell wall biosynthesis n=2 Tax=Paraburkholderia rhizosphaerae TaxID=480658 RepID=A0A4R8L3L5_9BURK|nr:glycosyltransferase involved in cell wall biosynthesis [Paraburkholderia rhizosphaerae]